MEQLRPIGTEFEIDFGVNSFSTDPRGRKIRYRVVDHKLFMGLDGKYQMAEAIKPISVEHYEIEPSKYNWNLTYGT